MLKYSVKRILLMILTLFLTTLFVFALLEFVPGDPARVIAGESATEESLANIREEFHLNDPFWVRFFNYVKNLCMGNLGVSYKTRQPIGPAIATRLPLTLNICVWGVIVGTLLGLISGVVSAVKQYSVADRILTAISLLGKSAPSFWVAMLFVLIFSIKLHLLPATGSYSFKYWILPVVTIGLQTSCGVMRMTRSSMLEVIRQDYIRTARAKGQKELVVIVKHGLRNAFIPILTQITSSICEFLGGAVLVESVFAIPGLGSYILEGVQRLDIPVVLSGVFLVCAMCSVVILVTDLIYAVLDPRIKATYGFGVKKKKKAAVATKKDEGGNK